MKDRPIKELRALFFPQEGTDPALLLDLAPVLPSSLVKEAIQAVRDSKFILGLGELLYTWIITALVTRLVEIDKGALHGIVHTDRLMLYYLPESLTTDALAEARTITDARERVDALSILLVHLSKAGQATITEEALAATRMIEDPRERDLAQGELVDYLLLGGNATMAFRAARARENEWERFRSLRELVPHLSEVELPDCVMEMVEIIQRLGFAWMLEDLAKQLAARGAFELALLTIQAIADAQRRMGALVELMPDLTETERTTILAEILATAKIIDGAAAQAEALISLLSSLPEAAQPVVASEALTMVRAIDNVQPHAEVLVKLVPYLSDTEQPNVLRQAMAATQVIADTPARVEILKKLLPYLPEADQPDVLIAMLNAVQMIDNTRSRAEVLEALEPYLLNVNDSTVLILAIKATRFLEDRRQRIEVLMALLLRLPEAERLSVVRETLELERTSSDMKRRAIVLGRLLPYLPEVERPALMEEVLVTVRAIERPEQRAATLADLVPYLPAPLQPTGLQEALRAARAIPSPNRQVPVWLRPPESESRVSALAYLAHIVPDTELSSVLTEVLAAARKMDDIEEQADILTELAKRMVERGAEVAALRAAMGINYAWRREKTLAELVGQLASKGKSVAALTVARAIDDARERAAALAKLVALLPKQLQQGVLVEAQAAARAIKQPVWRAIALADLVPYLPEMLRPAGLQEAVVAARAIRRLELRAAVQRWLVWREVEEGDAATALKMVRSIEWVGTRATILANLTPKLPLPLLREAWLLAQELPWESVQALVLASLTNQLVNLNQGSSLPDSTGIGPIRGHGERMRQLLARIPEEEQNALLKEVLRKLIAPPSNYTLEQAIQASSRDPLDVMREQWRAPIAAWAAPPEPERLVSPARQRPPERIVSTGFASTAQPDVPLDTAMPLGSDQLYYFWLEIGAPVAGSIEEVLTSLPDRVPPAAQLTIVLITFADELEVIPGADVGKIQLAPDGSVRVVSQPVTSDGIPLDSKLLEHRLFFPVRTPRKDGTFRLRCTIYYEGLEVQSRLIYARVMRKPYPGKRALRSIVDSTLTRTLNPAHLTQIPPYRLSFACGTHSFQFFSSDGVELVKSDDVQFGQGELQNMIEHAREMLHLASWGDKRRWQEWNPGENFTYLYDDTNCDRDRLKEALLDFALWGYNFYHTIIDRLAQGISFWNPDANPGDILKELMREPGRVQICMRKSPSDILPVALIYDYKLDTNAKRPEYKLCRDFVQALGNPDITLEELNCFKGACHANDNANDNKPHITICPSGFWGYRHSLGMPISLAETSGGVQEVSTQIKYQRQLQFIAGVSTDLSRCEEHEKVLKKLLPTEGWKWRTKREEIFQALKETKPHLVYFYCHGGLRNDVPYLQIGSSQDPEEIGPSNLRDRRILWNEPRPLVFLNGCRTTALEPKKALEFIRAFVGYARGAGVIGPEITVFEPLASAFAEECLRRFVAGTEIGEAIKGARLALLKTGNPLGLVYIPFVLPSLRLVRD